MSKLTTYLDALDNLAGGWNLASTSSDDPDASGNGNVGAVTLGTGSRGDTAIEAGGTLSLDFDGANTMVTVADDAAIQNIWDGGGTLFMLFNADSNGEDSVGLLYTKSDGASQIGFSSSGTGQLAFLVSFSGFAFGIWTTGDVVTNGRSYALAVTYDAASASNNPTMYLRDLAAETTLTLTVGDGLTETTSPTGTRVTDVGGDIVIGNSSFQDSTFDGRISVVRLYSDVLTATEIQNAFTLVDGGSLGPVSATYELDIDLDNSGLFDADEDITDDVTADLGAPLLSTSRGHDLTRVLSPPLAGSANFILDNTSGDYSPGGDLKAGRQARFRATYDGTTYDVWRGYLDHPAQSPPGGTLKRVNVQCFGNLARLAGRTVSTELYQQIKTGAAIEHLLDAARYPNNLQGYLDDLSPVGGWDLASTSGTDPDASGNGNDATITLGSGVRGADAIDDSGTLTTEFDGAATFYTVTAAAGIANFFATGGLIIWEFVADSDGESDAGKVLSKGSVQLSVGGQSGSAMNLAFSHVYSGVDGLWETTSRVVTVGNRYIAAVYFDRSAGTSADPTIWLGDIDAQTITVLTVGSGITESTTPTGTPTTDTSDNLIIGGVGGGVLTYDGRIGTVRLYDDDGDVSYWTPLFERAFDIACNAPRHIDTGETEINWWWLDNEDALAALEALKNSEGPGAALYEDGTGAIVFKGRYARNSESRSTSIQTTFDTSNEPKPGMPFEYNPGIKDVVNVCEIDSVLREAQSSAEVWALGEVISLAAGETVQLIARNSGGDPFTAAIAPTTGGGDYVVSSGSVTAVTLDRTSGAQVTITITSAAGATITGLRLRAQLVTVTSRRKATNTIDTSTSRETYGTHTYSLRVRPEIGFNLAQDFCNAIVGFYGDGRPTTTLTLHNNVTTERMTAALTREVSDRVRVIITDDLDQEMYIENVRHDVMTRGYQVTTFGLSQAQGIVSYFTLDDSVLDGTDVLAF